MPLEQWTEAMGTAFDSALDWLSLNSGTGEYYLLAIGAAGKTAEVNTVNSLLAKVRQEKEYDSPVKLARNIMMMSYCGFDTRNEDLNRLLTCLLYTSYRHSEHRQLHPNSR